MGGYDTKVSKVKNEIDNAIAADRYPRLMRALGNTPPTRGEIERVRLFGSPDGILPPPSQDRWSMEMKIEYSSRWKRFTQGTEDED